MELLLTLFYILFSICVVYPPTEFVSAGFTIAQLFDGLLGSENTNFVGYHMKRITLTIVVHSCLPLGYIFCLWCGGVESNWLLSFAALTGIIPLVIGLKLLSWWEADKRNHPVVKALLPYVTEGSDWRVVASNLNVQYRSVDKVSIQLGSTSKFVATEMWLIKVQQYSVNIVQQNDCTLVAVATDVHNLTPNGEDEIQYINIQAIPSRDDIAVFAFRLSSVALRDLQPRLATQVRVPDHLSLQPTLIERFVTVFKQHVDENPVYIVDEELESCIGCMQATADVKILRRCQPTTPEQNQPPCQQCNCRVLWCASCLARWWAARAGGAPGGWLAARGSCPLCRARCCVVDVCPARRAGDGA